MLERVNGAEVRNRLAITASMDIQQSHGFKPSVAMRAELEDEMPGTGLVNDI